MEEILKSLITSAVEDEVVEKTTNVLIETTAEPPQAVEVEDLALGLFDLALSTGFAEAAVVLAGGPVALVMGVKFLKQWRKKQKEKNEG
jgi:hypothetical protein